MNRAPGTLRVLGGATVFLIAVPSVAEPHAPMLQILIAAFIAIIAFFVVLYGVDAAAEHHQRNTPPRRDP
ncbi:MAG: hypothetical protein HC933_00495 [Pleurocapsa sp. SU_196_0]|nr:hypothetical protein [Pleurocapsa sp. SU_196_0]